MSIIYKLKGKIVKLKPTELILDVNDICYFLKIPFSTYDSLSNKNEVEIYVTLIIKENSMSLYGFYSENEKEAFELLISVPQIGPNIALSILSHLNYQELFDIVNTENINALTKIPGIGKSKAEKIMFELKRVLKRNKDINFKIPSNDMLSESIEALTSLGFDDGECVKIVREVSKIKNYKDSSELIKDCLKRLSKI